MTEAPQATSSSFPEDPEDDAAADDEADPADGAAWATTAGDNVAATRATRVHSLFTRTSTLS